MPILPAGTFPAGNFSICEIYLQIQLVSTVLLKYFSGITGNFKCIMLLLSINI